MSTNRKKYNRNKKKSNIKSIVNDEYVRPEVTPTDLLTAEQIRNRLYNYEKVNIADIKKLYPSTKIQYFEILDNGKFKYKPGGTIIVNKEPDYLVLTNGRRNWSVQLDNHIIFKEISVDRVREEYENIVATKNREIEHLRSLIRKQKRIISELENS